MANLPSIAQRLNDVEINNNAPVSSQTMRRVGSDINYLLDLVGANNGDTNPTGPLGTILQPTQNISFSTTIVSAQNNTDVPIFSFTGGGDRPLRWWIPSSGFEAPSARLSFDTSNLATIDTFYVTVPNSLPILYILNQIYTSAIGAGAAGSLMRVKINGVTAGTVSMVFSQNRSISYNREITIAPTGVHTVYVRPEFTSFSIALNANISGSFKAVAT